MTATEPEYMPLDKLAPDYLDGLAVIAHADDPDVTFDPTGAVSDEIPDHGTNIPDDLDHPTEGVA